MGPDVRHWPDYFEDLTDVTLADEDSNSIPTNDVNGQSQAMCQCKWRHLVAKIETNASWKRLNKFEEEKNIARGTTDPGYWVHNLNKLFQL